MKKVHFVVLTVFIFLFVQDLNATNLTKAQFDAAFDTAADLNAGRSTIQRDHESFETEMKDFVPEPNNLSSIFDLASGSTELTSDDGGAAAANNLGYMKGLVNQNAELRELETNLATVQDNLKRNVYGTDPAIKELLQKTWDYYKALKDYLVYKSADSFSKIYPEQDPKINPAELKRLESVVASKSNDIVVAKNNIPEADRNDAAEKVGKMYGDLKPSKPNYEDSDLIPNFNCDKEKDDCEKKAKQFMQSMISKGKPPQYVSVSYKKANSCIFEKLAKTLKPIANTFGQLACDREVRKNGVVKADGSINNKSLNCLSFFKNFSNPKDAALLAPDIAKLENVGSLNFQMLTQGQSLNAGGFAPTDVLNPGTTTNTQTQTPTATQDTTTQAATSSAGDGTTKYNADQASSFYAGASKTYSGMASSANTLVSSLQPKANTISDYNNQLTSAIVSANPKVSSIYDSEAKWATSTLASVSGTDITTRDKLRLEFSKEESTINGIITTLEGNRKKIGAAQFLALYGSDSQSQQSKMDVANYIATNKLLMLQGHAANTRLGLLRSSLGMSNIPYYNYFADYKVFRYYMYASNSDKNMPRALKLDNLETPVTLKKGWQNDFKAYIQQMSERSQKAKEEMNEAKIKIRKLLSQKIPAIAFEDLPQRGEVRDELINMQSIKRATVENMKVINKAMAYHNMKKDTYAKNMYEAYRSEYDSVAPPMQRTISSINAAEKPVSQANDLLKSLYKDVPRAEALRLIAKQMVAQGL